MAQVPQAFPFRTEIMLGKTIEQDEFHVQLRSLPTMTLAYIRVSNAYQVPRIANAYDRLRAWYKDHIGDPAKAGMIGMSQDDPDVTPLEECHYDICLTIPKAIAGRVELVERAYDEVSTRLFPACHIAAVHCQGDIYVVDQAWQYLYRDWLPRSPYQPDNLPAMELYRRQPSEIGWLTCDLDCSIPLVSLPHE